MHLRVLSPARIARLEDIVVRKVGRVAPVAQVLIPILLEQASV
jgi:hypothetical protein